MKSISYIRKERASLSENDFQGFIEAYEDDPRGGVQQIVASTKKSLAKWQAEIARVKQMRKFENEHPDLTLIAGIDEAGRGPLAGPVVAGAVILPKDLIIPYVNDSKKLSEKKREELYDVIAKEATAVGVGVISHIRIDEINILQATYEAMTRAVENLHMTPQLLLNDAVKIPQLSGIPQIPIVKGDAKSLSIASASIIAKVTRDRLMMEYDSLWPEYGFASNKGYGTADHIAAIRKYGPCPIHRMSFIQHFLSCEA